MKKMFQKNLNLKNESRLHSRNTRVIFNESKFIINEFSFFLKHFIN